MTTPPSYLTDHDDAVEEIDTLAHLLARLVHLTNTEGAPITHLELTVLAAQAAQRTSVQRAAACTNWDPGSEPVGKFAPMTAPERPLTPGEALAKLFMTNADRGANHANDELIAALRERARAIQALPDPTTMTTPHSPQLPEITPE